jgi:hypothetical protein
MADFGTAGKFLRVSDYTPIGRKQIDDLPLYWVSEHSL